YRLICRFFDVSSDHRYLHSFPTRRSSDLEERLFHRVLRRGVGADLRGQSQVVRPHADHRGHTGLGERSAPLESRAGREPWTAYRSEEHTSELQSRFDLVCRLLLEKKKKKI